MNPPWLEVAFKEVGVLEASGEADNPRVVEYHASTDGKPAPDEVSWCSSFVNWCIEQVGLEGTGSKRARAWLWWGLLLRHPAYGCVVVLQRGSGAQPGPEVIEAPGHVGFFLGFANEGSRVRVLGGNQRDSVCEAAYPVERVLGYRWPE